MRSYKVKSVYLVLLSMMISGCAIYDDPPPHEYATTTILETKNLLDNEAQGNLFSRVRIINPGVQVFSIDGKVLLPIANLDTGQLFHEAIIEPGEHEILLKTQKGFKSYPGFSMWDEARTTLKIKAEPNRIYTFSAIIKEDKVYFSHHTHGEDYDKICGDIIDKTKPSLKNYFNILEEGKIPLECY